MCRGLEAHQVTPEPRDRFAMASQRFELVTQSMEADDYYRDHTREECRIEWRRRYDLLKEGGM